MMDFSLTEEQKMLRDVARRFTDEVVRPRAAEIDEKEEAPRGRDASTMNACSRYGPLTTAPCCLSKRSLFKYAKTPSELSEPSG